MNRTQCRIVWRRDEIMSPNRKRQLDQIDRRCHGLRKRSHYRTNRVRIDRRLDLAQCCFCLCRVLHCLQVISHRDDREENQQQQNHRGEPGSPICPLIRRIAQPQAHNSDCQYRPGEIESQFHASTILPHECSFLNNVLRDMVRRNRPDEEQEIQRHLTCLTRPAIPLMMRRLVLSNRLPADLLDQYGHKKVFACCPFVQW